LWAAAVKVAGVSGISHTAKTLGVNYQTFKKRIAEAPCLSGKRAQSLPRCRHGRGEMVERRERSAAEAG
jgi:hypothetical protein